MRVSQIITDYIPKSILTNWGDMVTRGVSIPERVAQGALNHYLKSKGVGANPIFEAIDYSDWDFKIGDFILTATPQTIAGVGFRPVVVLLLAVLSPELKAAVSIGWDDTVIHNCIYQEYLTTRFAGFWRLSTFVSVALVEDTISRVEAYISSMTDDGFIMTSPVLAQNAHITYLALYWNAGVP